MKFTIEDETVTAPLESSDQEGRCNVPLAVSICSNGAVTTESFEGRAAWHYFVLDKAGYPAAKFNLASRNPNPSEIQSRIEQSQKWLSAEMSRLKTLREDLQTLRRASPEAAQ